MGTTPTYALPYPDLTSESNVPRDMQSLAEQVETALGEVGTGRAFATYRLAADQAFASGTQATAAGFAVDALNSSDNIGDFVSLNTGSGGGVWTILQDGFYAISFRQKWDANSSGHRYMYLRIDDVEVDNIAEGPGTASQLTLQYGFEAIYLTAGQDVRMRCMQNSGGSLDLIGSATGRDTYVSIRYLGE